MLNKISIDWKTIETVFLDMDGTLLDLHYDNHFWLKYVPIRYAEKHNLSAKDTENLLMTQAGSIKGTLNWYCIDYWSQQLDLDISALKQATSSRIKIRNNVIPFLQFLRQQKKRVILLTNAHPKTMTIKFQHATIEPYFDEIISSHTIGKAKEEAGFWERLQPQVVFDRQHSLFIDDSVSVLRAAQRYSIEHLLAIHQPDSQQEPVNTKEFTAIECFTQLF